MFEGFRSWAFVRGLVVGFILSFSAAGAADLELVQLGSTTSLVPADVSHLDDNLVVHLAGKRVEIPRGSLNDSRQVVLLYKAWVADARPMVILVMHPRRKPEEWLPGAEARGGAALRERSIQNPFAVVVDAEGELHGLMLSYTELGTFLTGPEAVKDLDRRMQELMTHPRRLQDLGDAVKARASNPNIAYLGSGADVFPWSCSLLLSQAAAQIKK